MGEGLENFTKENNREEGEVMDTPERSKNCQIATTIAKFEDSPVFNFLNSLSPIKPVKSTHISQTINPLSFASPPSVFTSPHVSLGKESRFLPRHQLADPSKPEFSFDEGSTVDKIKVNADAIMQLVEHQQNVNPKALDSEVNIERVNQVDQSKEATSCEWKNMISDTSNLLVFESPNDTDSYKKSIDPGTSFCISIKNDMLNMQSLCALRPDEHDGEGSEAEHLSTQPGEGNEMAENAETCDAIAGPSLTSHGEEMDYEHLPGFYRGMRRRCLVFEMAGARRKHLDENLASDSSTLLQSDGNTSSNDPKLVSMKGGNDSSCCVLPGIGLHLNALATASKDYRIVNNDSSASRRLLIGPSSSVNFHPSTTGQELFNNVLPVALSDRGIDRAENAVVPVDDGCQASGYVANEDTNQSSPKKRRRRAEHTVEGEACKRCNCKKSKCLKLYCECFAAGVYCVEPCACIDCFNKPIHEDTVLATRKQIESRNPLAFAPKVIRGTDSLAETGDDSSKTPASARHKRGCNCKKSGCLKKYCECYQGGVGCSFNCRCEGCKNAFGRKDGMEAEVEEHATDMKDKSVVDRSFEKTTIENNLEQNTDSVPLGTPLRRARKSVHLPFSSNKKPPRSSFPSVGSSSQGLGNSSFLPPPPGLEKHFETVREDEMPDFLQEGSPNSGIKMSSPTQKRVSPPHSAGMSPGLRSSRKLILKSIPSFPSLAQ